MSTIVWNISAMNCYPQAEGETDVVFTVRKFDNIRSKMI